MGIWLYSMANGIVAEKFLQLDSNTLDFGKVKPGDKVESITNHVCIKNKGLKMQPYMITIKSKQEQASQEQFYLTIEENGKNKIPYTIKWFDPKNASHNQEVGITPRTYYSEVRRCRFSGSKPSYFEVVIPAFSSTLSCFDAP